MDISSVGLADSGLQLTRTAQQHADEAARRAVGDPSAPEPRVDLRRAVDEGKLGAKLLRANDELTGALLDVLA
jgi:hypothetical protein